MKRLNLFLAALLVAFASCEPAFAGQAVGSATVTESQLSTSDVTTGDVSTSKHGFAPKAPNDATKFLDGTGAWTVPATGGKLYVPLSTGGATALTVATSATQGDSDVISIMVVPKTATYKIICAGWVSAVSGTPTTLNLKSHATYALAKSSPPGSGSTTLYAAATTIASYNKGSAFAAGDTFTMSSSNISLTQGDIVYGVSGSTMFSFTVNSATSINIYYNTTLVEQ